MGPHKDSRKTLTRVGIEPTTFGLDLRCSNDWAARSDRSRPWEMKVLKSRQWTCTSTRKGYVFTNVGRVARIQLFWERLSEKVHATILKGIVSDFKCTVFQRNLKESYGRPLIYVCECWRKVTKVGSTATVVRNSVLIISHITFRDCRVHFILDKLSRNSCIPRKNFALRLALKRRQTWTRNCQILWSLKCYFMRLQILFHPILRKKSEEKS